MRKSMDGLSAVVAAEMGHDIYGKNLFVFCNRGRDRLKLLYWDRTGFAIWFKRLERARFKWPVRLGEAEVIELTSEQMQWLLDGIDVQRVRRHEEIKFEKIL